MKNTNDPVQNVLDRANRTRQAEHEKISSTIRRFRVIAALATTWAEQLEQDPSYRYGQFPYEDVGPADLDYRRPSGCDGSLFRDFAGHD